MNKVYLLVIAAIFFNFSHTMEQPYENLDPMPSEAAAHVPQVKARNVFTGKTTNIAQQSNVSVNNRLHDRQEGESEENAAIMEGKLQAARAIAEENELIKHAIATAETRQTLTTNKAITTAIAHIAQQEYLKNNDPEQNLEARKNSAANKAIASAVGYIAQQEYLKKNDPELSIKRKLIVTLQKIAIQAAAELAVSAAIKGCMLGSQKAYDLYLQLPFEHCKQLKEHHAKMAEFKQFNQAHQRMKDEKKEAQNALLIDTQILKDQRDNLSHLDAMINTEKDKVKKENLEKIRSQIQQEYLFALAKHNRNIALNTKVQPHLASIKSFEAMKSANKQFNAQNQSNSAPAAA